MLGMHCHCQTPGAAPFFSNDFIADVHNAFARISTRWQRFTTISGYWAWWQCILSLILKMSAWSHKWFNREILAMRPYKCPCWCSISPHVILLWFLVTRSLNCAANGTIISPVKVLGMLAMHSPICPSGASTLPWNYCIGDAGSAFSTCAQGASICPPNDLIWFSAFLYK